MIKTFSQYVNENLTSLVGRYKYEGGLKKEEQINEDDVLQYACLQQSIKKIHIHGNVVDIEGSFHLKKGVCKDGHLPLKFGTVTGDFNCDNSGLTSFEGFPNSVGGNLNCTYNSFTSIKGCTPNIGGILNLSNNSISSLEGFQIEAKEVKLTSNKLSNLKGCPETFNGTLYFNNMPSLTSLEGAPKHVEGCFYIDGCGLTSLKFAPEYVGETFKCSFNNITSLEGGPEHVGGHFVCSYNKLLTSIKGCPKEVGSFYCDNNKSLTSLEGGPTVITGKVKKGSSVYSCCDCNLINFIGAPEIINGHFIFDMCGWKTSLEGFPKKVTGYISTMHDSVKDADEIKNICDCDNIKIRWTR